VIGLTVSHYRVTGKLGVGGMGIVYEAEDIRLPRRVALKFLSDELAADPDAKRRLTREAHTIALLNHPNICTIYEIEEYEGRPVLVMELLPGLNLKALMAKKTLETREIVEISVQIAQALEAAHAKNIVHRDIKPGNIVVSERGDVKVLDFGLARRFSPDDESGVSLPPEGSTIPGRPIGTASYMAPERIMQLPIDGRCDLFSLGVVIYEMATGRLAFTGSSPSETVTNILEKEPALLTALSPDRPVKLARIVAKLLAKRPDDRCQTAAELHERLAALGSGRRSLFGLIRPKE
jgi:serine/threonine protein kinase